MTDFNWSISETHNTDELFRSYLSFKGGTCDISDFLSKVVNLVHLVLNEFYSSISDFDKDDMIAVSVEKIYTLIYKNWGIFKLPLDKLHPVGFCHYLKSVISCEMRSYLNNFCLYSINIPEFEYRCECGNIKKVCHHEDQVLSIVCTECNNKMSVYSIRDIRESGNISYSSEYSADLETYIKSLHKKIKRFMLDHNRFNLTDSVIDYFIDSTMRGYRILHKCLRSTYGRKKPSRDVDNLNFLYAWALCSLLDDYNFVNNKRYLEHAI